MKQAKRKPKKLSLVDVINKYSNDEQECIKFFFDAKWSVGFYCEKCGCIHYSYAERHPVFRCNECHQEHYLFANTIFQDNKLPLFKLILGIYLFLTSTKGISAMELRNQLDVNYKTSQLLSTKLRLLMSESNNRKTLTSGFYESDVFYIGSQSKGKRGMATEQQPVLSILSTDQENNYPKYIKLKVIQKDNQENINRVVKNHIELGKNRTLNADGKTTYNGIANKLNIKMEKISYKEENPRLKWTNIIIGNIQNNIIGIYHGISKREMPLFISEMEWRFNHRYSGITLFDKVKNYITYSTPSPRKEISRILDLKMALYA